MGIYRVIDQKYLTFLLVQMLGFPHAHGLGHQQSDDAVTKAPELLRQLYGNAEVLGEWLRRQNRDLIRKRMNRKFYIQPYFNLSGLTKKLEKQGNPSTEETERLPDGFSKHVTGGCVTFEAFGRIQANLSVGIGFELEVRTGDKRINTNLYSCFYATDDSVEETTDQYGNPHRQFPNETTAINELKELLRRSVKEARSHLKGPPLSALNALKMTA